MTTHCYECEREKLGDIGGLVSGSPNNLCKDHQAERYRMETRHHFSMLCYALQKIPERTIEEDALLSTLKGFAVVLSKADLKRIIEGGE